MAVSLPPQPLLTPVTQPGDASSGGNVIHRIWSQWFNTVANAIQRLFATCPQIVVYQDQEGLTADLPTTVLYAVPAGMTGPMYRVTCHNDLNLAGGKCITSITYTCKGTARTVDGTQVTNIADPVSWTFLLDPDPGTTIYYYTTCVIPGGGIDYDVNMFVEYMPS